MRAFVDEGAVDMALGNPRLAEIHRIILAQRMALELVVKKNPS
jgi:hypothetical protein